ncbi:MAG: IlvD/Edd family dehydratase [Caldilineaceae bacterium]
MTTHGLSNQLTEYGDREFALYLRRSFAKAMGYSDEALSKPIIGIVNTFSDLNNCHHHFPQLVEAIKRGVWQAGGLPLEFPTISLGEVFLSPTSMMYRNLMSMDVEAMIKAQPLDSVVLLGGCDKTIPALLMGAASANLPAIAVVGGPMLTSNVDGERLGACTDCRRYWAKYRRGEIDREMIDHVEGQLAPTVGSCGVMGTASTMACLTEALGMMLPGGAAIPAVYADRNRHAEAAGKQAVKLLSPLTPHPSILNPQTILTPAAFENAIRVLLAIGGSTNGIVHLLAIAGRLGIQIELQRLDELSATTPVLVDLKPTGDHYMEDFHRAGGLPVVLQELKSLLHLDALTVTGKTLGELLDRPYQWPAWQTVIRPASNPLQNEGALVVLKGNLAPDGAILKRSAATAAMLNSRGRAVVFSSLQDLAQRIDDPNLDVKPDDFLVLQNAGPIGGPGMPEAGYLPIPKKLTGVKDMVRISDARMSGTAFGTVVLHVSPEAAIGGPLGLVRSGDWVELSVDRRELNLLVDAEELERRRQEHPLVKPNASRGYEALYYQHVQQAHLGVDFDFLRHESLQTPP